MNGHNFEEQSCGHYSTSDCQTCIANVIWQHEEVRARLTTAGIVLDVYDRRWECWELAAVKTEQIKNMMVALIKETM